MCQHCFLFSLTPVPNVLSPLLPAPLPSAQVDLVSESDKADVLEAIRVINNTARIVECQLNDEHGRPSLLDVLGTNTFSVQRALTVSSWPGACLGLTSFVDWMGNVCAKAVLSCSTRLPIKRISL